MQRHPQPPEVDPTEGSLVIITQSLTWVCPGHFPGLEDIPGSKCELSLSSSCLLEIDFKGLTAKQGFYPTYPEIRAACLYQP